MNENNTICRIENYVDALLNGQCDWSLISPFPSQGEGDKAEGDRFLRQFDSDLRGIIDPDADVEGGRIPPSAFAQLAAKGYLGLRVPKEYGGLGLSEFNYFRTMSLAATWCLSTTCTLLAHSSVGLTGPLRLFGTEEQKRKYLPRLARGELSGFALTEPEVGNDYTRTRTRLVPSGDGYILTGEKLFITNAPIARLLCVFARLGDCDDKYSLAIVETGEPGFSVAGTCSFLGLPSVHNGLVRFDHMRIARDAVVGASGHGLDYLIGVATGGWTTVASISAGVARQCLRIMRDWANRRVQWHNPIGQHQAIQRILSRAASETYAIESVANLTIAASGGASVQYSALARAAKYFGQEHCWRVVDDALQVCGARGCETSRSARQRANSLETGSGEELTAPIERIFRDFRVFRLAEGSSQTLPLMASFDLLAAFATGRRQSSDGQLALSRTLPGLSVENLGHAAYVSRAAERLGEEVHGSVAKYGAQLEGEQAVLTALGDIFTDLVAMSATLARTNSESVEASSRCDLQQLADYFCRNAEARIDRNLERIRGHEVGRYSPLSNRLLSGGLDWIIRDVAQA